MRIFIFLFAFIIFTLPSFGQNFLELKNTQTGKTRILKPGAKLFFKSTGDSDFVKGKIVQIKDTSVVVYCPDNDEEMPLVDVSINNMIAIKKATGIHSVTRTIGAALTPVGAYFFLNGIFTLMRNNDQETTEQAVVLTASGLGLIAVGFAPYLLVKPKVYDLKKDWTLSVKKNAR